MQSRTRATRLAACRGIGPFAMAAALLSVALPVNAQQDDAEAGHAIATEYCAECHAVGEDGESPMAEAPPFRDLHLSYPVEHLAEALAEGIMVGHPEMPVFVLDPMEIEAFIAFLKTLEPEQ